MIVVDQAVEETNTLVRLWIDTRTAMAVKVLQQDGNVITLAGPSVVDGVQRVDMDKYILDETNVAIADVPAISYMKVRARIRPIGLRPTPESLNVPGQSFQGTVENNLIEGIFEIEHRRFDGTGAPSFPVLDPPAGFEEYLGADNVYEADDTVLVEKARKLTAGAADVWEAATRLSRWVTDEISYAIPGGGTARNTYNLRAGECGAHSILLATFCRAVGIPARVVWGCMYTPDRGGAFGQHGWTEVYMGPAGWIPVDATAGETDYVDSGHIRVAELVSLVSRLNAQEFEILDYRLSGGSTNSAEAAERYASFCGTYRRKGSPARYEVKIMDGCLVVNLPSRALLALNDPDDRGRWVCKMTKGLYLTFDRGNEGEITGLVIHERASLRRRDGPETKDRRDVPADLAPYIGRYHHAATGKDFEVIARGPRLALRHPGLDKTFDLEPEADGSWRTSNAPYTALFLVDDGGKVVTLILEEENAFLRTTPG